MSNFIICTTQRSGKTWVAYALQALGAGRAHEHITALHRGNETLINAFERQGLNGFIQSVLEEQQCDFAGVSVPWNEFKWFAGVNGVAPEKLLKKIVINMQDAKIIYLKRRDVVAQGISHYLLRSTGYGHSFQRASSRGGVKLGQSVEYNGTEIARLIGYSLEGYRSWEVILSNFDHYKIYYEDLVDDPLKNMTRLAEFIGLKVTKEQVTDAIAMTEKISSEINDILRQAFYADSENQSFIRKHQLEQIN